mmetsp:Transcript_59986/g.186068  ORF Transcript_59986/g.186068 Transcript_59986/m.186068 type:complete len:273 (+) Transcript_59986:492-1310(+)
MVDLLLGFRDKDGSMPHGPQERNDKAQWVHGGFFATEVGVPEVSNGAVRGLILLDERPILALAREDRADETRTSMHLRHLVREHVAVVVVARHAEAAIRPTDDLHGGRVTDEVAEFPTLQQARSDELVLVVSVKDVGHNLPEALLPFEDGLLRDDVGLDMILQAPREEYVSQVLDVVQGVVVDHDGASGVGGSAAVDDHGLIVHVLREEGCEDPAFADLPPTSTVLATHCVTVNDDRALEAELDARNVNGVPRDGYAFPAAAHGAVRGTPGL